MGELATIIDDENGNMNCMYCEARFVSMNQQLYCSDECRGAMTALRLRRRHDEDYTYIKETKTGLFYREYVNENDKSIAKYGIVPPPERRVGSTPSYKVPELNFKRFKEKRNVLIASFDQEKLRERWE